MKFLQTAILLLFLVDTANCGYYDKDLMEDHLILIKPIREQPRKKVVKKRAASQTTKRTDPCGPKSK